MNISTEEKHYTELKAVVFKCLKAGWSRSDQELNEDRPEVKKLNDSISYLAEKASIENIDLIKPSGIFNQTEMLHQLTKHALRMYDQLVSAHLDATFHFTLHPRAAKYKAELKKELKKLATQLRTKKEK